MRCSKDYRVNNSLSNQSKLVQIFVQGFKLGEVAGKNGATEKFPKTANLFPESTTPRRSIGPPVFDGQVN